MEQPVQFTWTQLTPEERARVIAILVQMILRQWSQREEAQSNDIPRS